MIPGITLLGLFVLFHIFSLALNHINLLKWLHLLEKYPESFTMVARMKGNIPFVRVVFDLYRIILLVASLLLLIPHVGIAATLTLIAAVYLTVLLVTILLVDDDSAEALVRVLYPAMKVFLLPFFPLAFLTRGARVDGDIAELATDEEVNAYLSLGKDEGILEPIEGELFQSVVDFSDTLAREVMTPRTDMVVVKVDATADQLVQTFLETRHSRIPIVGENLDDVKGIVHVKDCLDLVTGEGGEQTLEALLRAPWFVPETKKIVDLMQEMRETHQHMAIVIDEYGGTAGLATLEDLLEEIVGEIADEHEEDEDEVVEISPGTYSLDGKVHVDTLDDLFDVSIEDMAYDTVGGLLVTLLGQVPVNGTSISHMNLVFEVVEADDRRVRRVKVWREETPSEQDDG